MSFGLFGLNRSIVDPYADPYPAVNADAETGAWAQAASAAGGGFQRNSIGAMAAFASAFKAKSYEAKFVWMLPMLGANAMTAFQPWRDSIGVGRPTITGFTDSEYGQGSGIQGGSGKIIDTKIKPSQLGSNNNGGLGFWDNSLSFAGTSVEPMGCYDAVNSTRFVLDLRTNLAQFRWGSPGNFAGNTTTPTSGHFYGQRSSPILRALYKNGSQVGTTNTTSDGAAGAGANTIQVLACNEGGPQAYWGGRCAFAYLTDGTLTTGEIADFDQLLRDSFFTLIARPTA